MNKRICFAGFTGEEVVSIKQAVTGNVRAWDCAFAQDGPDTIAEISAEPYDAVVANLQMDGMRGDEVLQQAVKLQPDACGSSLVTPVTPRSFSVASRMGTTS